MDDQGDLLAALIKAEQHIVSYNQPAPDGESPVCVLAGSSPVLISAPHSAQHWREGHWKQEEEYTAALGYLLHQTTGAHLIYGRYLLNPDPHDDNDSGSYKRALDDLFATTPIRVVLDLHGARGDRDFAIALGTIRDESFAVYDLALRLAFERQGFTPDAETSLDRLVMNPPRYTGGIRQPTITRYVWRQHHIPAVQIEMSAWVRVVQRLPNASNARNGSAPDFRGDGKRIVRAYAALQTFVDECSAQ
ncbi:MAG: hypothetical protein ABI947_03975 [Chloroflexota bacterium]